MPYILPTRAVRTALYALFVTDEALAALTPGGIQTDVGTEAHEYPFLWVEVFHDQNYGGLGTSPGHGSMPGISVRLHVFQGDYGTLQDAETVMERAIFLLWDTDGHPLGVEGYTVCAGGPMPETSSFPLSFELLNNVPVKELVQLADLILEEVAA
jgi:hypothetical protein